MTSEHAPAPWAVATQGPALRFQITDANGAPVAMTYGQPTQSSDAALIRAAPAMLAALENVLLADKYDGALTMGTARLSPAIADMIERTIAMARGTPTGEGGQAIPAAQSGEA